MLVILFFTFLASIVSLALVATLLVHKTLMRRISFDLVAFAAGALLATGLLDTFPEAVKENQSAFLWVLLSIAGFFIIERLFLALHHHDDEDEKDEMRLPASLLMFGDALHNAVDGASIAAAFLASYPLGIVTTTAVFIHEIPHELGDFGILLHKGWSRKNVLLFNFVSGIAAIVGALVAYYLGITFSKAIPILLAVATGNFIYLSAADLLPEIHKRAKKSLALNHVFFFLLGIGLIYLLIEIIG